MIGAPRPAQRAPLSFQQEDLLRTLRTWPECSRRYDVARLFDVRGALDAAALGGAFSDVAEQHAVLRTTIGASGSEEVQCIHPPAALDFGWWEPGESDLAGRVLALRHDLAAILAGAPLFRVRLVRLAPDHHQLVVLIHHLLCDGLSLPLLWDDLSECYAARIEARTARLPVVTATYADYARRQREEWPRRADAALRHWRGVAAGSPDCVAWPRPAATAPAYDADQQTFTLPAMATAGVRALGRTARVPPFLVLLTATGLAIARVTRQHDLMLVTDVGDPDAVFRRRMLGLLLNRRLTRIRMATELSLDDAVNDVRTSWLDADEFRDVDLDRVLRELGVSGVTPVHLDTNALRATPSFAGTTVVPVPLPHKNPYWREFLVTWRMTGSECGVQMTYRPSRVHPAVPRSIADEVVALLSSVAA